VLVVQGVVDVSSVVVVHELTSLPCGRAGSVDDSSVVVVHG